MRSKAVALIAFLMSLSTHAQVGRGGNVLYEDDTGGDIFGPWLIPVLIGAAIGYFCERAYNKAKLDKQGINYSSDYLGGKIGACVGAIALPLLIGLLR